MVAPRPRFVIGLDLHGTLLEPGEIIRTELIEPTREAIDRLGGRAEVFICTGNDLEFTLRKVPQLILAAVAGHVLETGCSWSPDGKTERVLTTDAERRTIADLEQALRARRFPEINYFAHRLTTISMFCDDPRGFFSKVADFVKTTAFFERVLITYSSVAVDVLPRGYNKAKGLIAVADGRPTIGIADSMNDLALLAEADHALAPANLAPELVPILAQSGRSILPIGQARGLPENAVVLGARRETEGVIELLNFLDGAL